MAQEEGFEPPTSRLTAGCSTTELLLNRRRKLDGSHGCNRGREFCHVLLRWGLPPHFILIRTRSGSPNGVTPKFTTRCPSKNGSDGCDSGITATSSASSV